MTFYRAILVVFFVTGSIALAAKAPISIAEPNRTTPVDFDQEIRPFLSDNCLSCHARQRRKAG